MSADVEGLIARLDRAHRMSCSDPTDLKRKTLYSEARDALAAARREGQRDGWDEGWKAGQHSRMTAPLPDENLIPRQPDGSHPMSDHDTTPGAPETEALAELLTEHDDCDWCSEDGEIANWSCGVTTQAFGLTDLARYNAHQAAAVVAAGWISPTEAATRDAAQRAAGWDECLQLIADTSNVLPHGMFTSIGKSNPYRGAQC